MLAHTPPHTHIRTCTQHTLKHTHAHTSVFTCTQHSAHACSHIFAYLHTGMSHTHPCAYTHASACIYVYAYLHTVTHTCSVELGSCRFFKGLGP
jgi:hypothetical protein